MTSSPQVKSSDSFGIEPDAIPDPGAGGAFDVSRSGFVLINTAEPEFRTLPAPTFAGQEIEVVMRKAGGDCLVTSERALNAAGARRFVLSVTRDCVLLTAHMNAEGTLAWVLTANEGAVLS